MNALYKWNEVYKAALLETEWSRMEDRIRAAEDAIAGRRRELDLSGGGTAEENEALCGAIRSLNVLRMEATSWSGRDGKEAS